MPSPCWHASDGILHELCARSVESCPRSRVSRLQTPVFPPPDAGKAIIYRRPNPWCLIQGPFKRGVALCGGYASHAWLPVTAACPTPAPFISCLDSSERAVTCGPQAEARATARSANSYDSTWFLRIPARPLVVVDEHTLMRLSLVKHTVQLVGNSPCAQKRSTSRLAPVAPAWWVKGYIPCAEYSRSFASREVSRAPSVRVSGCGAWGVRLEDSTPSYDGRVTDPVASSCTKKSGAGVKVKASSRSRPVSQDRADELDMKSFEAVGGPRCPPRRGRASNASAAISSSPRRPCL